MRRRQCDSNRQPKSTRKTFEYEMPGNKIETSVRLYLKITLLWYCTFRYAVTMQVQHTIVSSYATAVTPCDTHESFKCERSRDHSCTRLGVEYVISNSITQHSPLNNTYNIVHVHYTLLANIAPLLHTTFLFRPCRSALRAPQSPETDPRPFYGTSSKISSTA